MVQQTGGIVKNDAKTEDKTEEKSGAQPVTISVLCADWEQSVACQVKPSTFACYRTVIQKHILPYIGEYPIHELNNEILLDFILEKREQGLAESTQRLIIFLVKSIVHLGGKKGKFPAEALDYHVPRDRKLSMKLLSQEHMKILMRRLTAARNDFELGLLVSLCTGIRVGELCGLRWEDVDFDTGILRIRRTVSRIRNEEFPLKTHIDSRPIRGEETSKTLLYIGTPKTRTSMRDIPLPDFVMIQLLKRKKADASYLLTGSRACMEPRGVQRRFKNLLRKCGLPIINIHSLRHSFASQWIENGFDSKSLSEILGHSSVRITMDIYVHSNMKQKRDYMNRMAAM